MNNKIIEYGDERLVINSISDEIKFLMCLKLYNTFDTIEQLENALTEEASIKLNNN